MAPTLNQKSSLFGASSKVRKQYRHQKHLGVSEEVMATLDLTVGLELVSTK